MVPTTVKGSLPSNILPTSLSAMPSIAPTSFLRQAALSTMSAATRAVDIHGKLKVENESHYIIGELSHAQFQLRGMSL